MRGKYSRSGVRDRYFLTRDCDPDGTVSEIVDVWLTRPIRHRITTEGGYVWLASDERTYRSTNHGRAMWQQISLAECQERFATYPADERMCMLLAEVPDVR